MRREEYELRRAARQNEKNAFEFLSKTIELEGRLDKIAPAFDRNSRWQLGPDLEAKPSRFELQIEPEADVLLKRKFSRARFSASAAQSAAPGQTAEHISDKTLI